MDLLGLVLLQGFVDVVRDFGGEQFVAGLCDDARDVEADVAHADDGDGLGVQVPVLRELRVGVVEADELSATVGGLRARQVEVAVLGRAGGVDDGVVVLLELLEGDILADVDVAEQADLRLVEDAVQGADNALDAGVVGCDAVADEPEWGWHALEDVHAHAIEGDVAASLRDGGLGEGVGCVNAGWAGSDDRDAERTSGLCCV